jgi:hypothetical protein
VHARFRARKDPATPPRTASWVDELDDAIDVRPPAEEAP